MNTTQPTTKKLLEVGRTFAAQPYEPPFLNKGLQQITLNDGTWNIVSTGAVYKNGIYCHLSSVDKSLVGKHPIQKFVWVNINLIKKNKKVSQ